MRDGAMLKDLQTTPRLRLESLSECASVISTIMGICPKCKEEAKEDAKVCGGCHFDLTVAPTCDEPVQSKTSRKAIASLISGFLSLICLAGLIAGVLLDERGTLVFPEWAFDYLLLLSYPFGILAIVLGGVSQVAVCLLDEFFQVGLEERDFASFQSVNLLFVCVQAGHLVT